MTEAYWRDEAVPELRGHYAWIDRLAVEALPGDELSERWDEAWTRIGRCWSIHFYAIRGPYQVLDDLADRYEAILPDAPPGQGLALISGGVHELHDVERRLESLAALVAATPALKARIGRPHPTVAELTGLPGGDAFATELDAFLVEHGHLGQPFDDLEVPSWAEEPVQLLVELATRIEHPPAVGAEARREGLATDADELADDVRMRLSADPDALASFEALLTNARQIGPLTEIHNYWIDRMAQATLRRFVFRVAGRLVGEGVLDAPADVLYLRREEVPALLRRPEDRRDLVTARQAEHAHWRTVRPPAKVGAPSTDDGEGDRFDGNRVASTGPDEVRGTGASAGVVRGPARVILDQAGFGSVEPGDIIVCPSSNPSWVALFAIAGGLITNTGGVLSHAAVVAREFALPAVVGTGDATTRIANGRMVELDGSSGIVRLL